MEKLQIYNNSVTNKQTKTTKSNIVMGIEVDMKTIAIVNTIERDLRPTPEKQVGSPWSCQLDSEQ